MQKNLRLAVIEDDELFLLFLKEALKDYGQVTTFKNAVNFLNSPKKDQYDIIFTDLNIDETKDGFKILEYANSKDIYSVMISSSEDTTDIETAYQLGCVDYITKDGFKKSIPYILEKYNYKQARDSYIKDIGRKFHSIEQNVAHELGKLAMNLGKVRPILLTGETGTGKSLLAKAHHEFSLKNKPFIHLNCSEFNENLIESELFGHKKGSFTGADKDKKGRLELANGGTLFLDEIGTIPKSVQSKLLVALEEKQFYPIGSEEIVSSNFLLITATCDNLQELINSSQMRLDFYHRITGIRINIPPLRERPNDIIFLLEQFLSKSPKRIILQDGFINECKEAQWRGNIRELLKFSEAILSSDKGILTAQDYFTLSEQIRVNDTNPEEITDKMKEYILQVGLDNYLNKIEKEIVHEVFKKNNEHVRKTLKELNISSTRLYRVLGKKNYGKNKAKA